MNATCFPYSEKITILWNHLTVRIASRNELKWLLPAKHQNKISMHLSVTKSAVSWFCQFFITEIQLPWAILLSSAELFIWIWGQETMPSFVKQFCMLMWVFWVIKECYSLLTLCFFFSRLIKCCHPLVTVAPWHSALLVACHTPISHMWVWWETRLSLQPTLVLQAFAPLWFPSIITLALLHQII